MKPTGSIKLRSFKGPGPETSTEPLDAAILEAVPSQLHESINSFFVLNQHSNWVFCHLQQHEWAGLNIRACLPKRISRGREGGRYFPGTV